MVNILSWGVLICVLMTGSLLQAQMTKPNCPENLVAQGAWQFQTTAPDASDCYVSADLMNVPNSMIYRSFLVSESGTLMVFNSYDAAMTATSTGARVYTFFPRKNLPSVSLASGTGTLHFANPNLAMILNTQNGNVAGFQGIHAVVASEVNRNNKGGVEVTSADTLWLDSGFELGKDPTSIPTHQSIFHDPQGRQCVLNNPQIFNITADGDSTFKFSDQELELFLQKECPNLDLSSLSR